MKLSQLLPSVLVATAWPLSGAVAQAPCEVLTLDGPGGSYPKFGYSISFSKFGDRIAIGEPKGGPDKDGRAHVYDLDAATGSWSLAASVSASDEASYDYLRFGYSVAVDGDTLVVGAPWSADIDGTILAVGAKGAGALNPKGMVSIFEHEGSSWVEKEVIKPVPSIEGNGFGSSLDLDGERLVVGAPHEGSTVVEGRAFVFERTSPFVWAQKAMLSAEDLSVFDQFGRAVALDQDRVVVGAPLHDLPAKFVGAAYVFDLVGTTWTQTGKLTPSDWPTLDTFPDRFAWSLDVQGGRCVVGADTAGSWTTRRSP